MTSGLKVNFSKSCLIALNVPSEFMYMARNFLKWSKVCQPKAKGGLGVRDVRRENLSLLVKW